MWRNLNILMKKVRYRSIYCMTLLTLNEIDGTECSEAGGAF